MGQRPRQGTRTRQRRLSWFWSWDEKTQDFAGGRTFDGNRWNDLHYTNAFKQAARVGSEKGNAMTDKRTEKHELARNSLSEDLIPRIR